MVTNVPDLMRVRALTGAGPFAIDDTISIAFTDATIGRMQRHADAEGRDGAAEGEGLVPDAFSARVETDAGPYLAGDVVTLSFVDPRFARIHPTAGGGSRATTAVATAATAAANGSHAARTLAAPAEVAVPPPGRDEPVAGAARPGVRVRLDWSAERARRFVGVVDRLFTVDRLGWYRHVLAMRLLIPDEIACGDGEAQREANRRLQTLRAATIETLGRPLLAAYMPTFCVTQEWLETIDSPALARGLAGLRDAIVPFADDGAAFDARDVPEDASIGILRRAELVGPATASADAFLPVLVASQCTNARLTEALAAYRADLMDVFAQTARSSDEVRLGRMSEPSVVLDDRLWQLAGAVESSHAKRAVAS
jgi:hypothetical protein